MKDSADSRERPFNRVMPGNRGTMEVSVERFAGSHVSMVSDILAVEEPVEIQLAFGPVAARRLKSISVTMRTPGHDFELSVGFLMTEGVIEDVTDIERITYVAPQAGRKPLDGQRQVMLPDHADGNVVRVELAPDVEVKLANLERNFYTTSSCGICGKASLLALRTVSPPHTSNDFEIPAGLLCTLPAQLRNAQNVFEETGGLHAAGLINQSGELVSVREDVGRHNAVDKLLGAEFLGDRTPLRDSLLLLSGRASFELIQKSVMGGIPMVVSLGAPSSLAVQVAKEFDITLVGFLRRNYFNVYHGVKRITGCSLSRLVEVI